MMLFTKIFFQPEQHYDIFCFISGLKFRWRKNLHLIKLNFIFVYDDFFNRSCTYGGVELILSCKSQAYVAQILPAS